MAFGFMLLAQPGFEPCPCCTTCIECPCSSSGGTGGSGSNTGDPNTANPDFTNGLTRGRIETLEFIQSALQGCESGFAGDIGDYIGGSSGGIDPFNPEEPSSGFNTNPSSQITFVTTPSSPGSYDSQCIESLPNYLNQMSMIIQAKITNPPAGTTAAYWQGYLAGFELAAGSWL